MFLCFRKKKKKEGGNLFRDGTSNRQNNQYIIWSLHMTSVGGDVHEKRGKKKKKNHDVRDFTPKKYQMVRNSGVKPTKHQSDNRGLVVFMYIFL